LRFLPNVRSDDGKLVLFLENIIITRSFHAKVDADLTFVGSVRRRAVGATIFVLIVAFAEDQKPGNEAHLLKGMTL